MRKWYTGWHAGMSVICGIGYSIYAKFQLDAGLTWHTDRRFGKAGKYEKSTVNGQSGIPSRRFFAVVFFFCFRI